MVVWLAHARVGHRQGLYPESPSPETVGVFLWLAFSGLGMAAVVMPDHPYQQRCARPAVQQGLPVWPGLGPYGLDADDHRGARA
jgi:hypothetical protein